VNYPSQKVEISLNHSKYLQTIGSERRQVAHFQSVGVQDQLINIREDITRLFDMVEKLIDMREMEHGVTRYPKACEIIAASDLSTSSTIATWGNDSLYL
jgi:hypothetical protein